MDVFGMAAWDIAVHGIADPDDTLGWLYMLLKYVEVWISKDSATYCGQIKDPEHLSFFAKCYLQLPHEMYFNSDRSMAKDIDITAAAATFFSV